MRLILFATAFASLCASLTAAAQSAGTTASASGSTQDQIALSTRPERSAAPQPMQLACAPLLGQVFEPNGQPLIGATLMVKGTHQVYVTDSDGKFQLTETVYQGQTLAVGAAGYTTQDVSLDDCTLPRLVLERDASARIKRSGKRAGQVVRLNNKNTNLK